VICSHFLQTNRRGRPEGARAQLCLGVCYAEGAGVAQDMDEAEKWLRKAAEQGCQPAIEMLQSGKESAIVLSGGEATDDKEIKKNFKIPPCTRREIFDTLLTRPEKG